MADPAEQQCPSSFDEQERDLRAKVRNIIGLEAIKAYRDLDLSHTLRDLLFIYSTLFGGVAVEIYLHAIVGPLVLMMTPVLALLSGIAFNWINVQIHEASHHLLLRDKRRNDFYCNVALGSFALQDVQTYRATHGMHHAHLHTDQDPDLEIYSSEVGSWQSVLRGIRDDLLLISALRRRRQVAEFLRANELKEAKVPLHATTTKVLAQLTVLSAFLYSCGSLGIVYYGAFYLYGLVGIFPVLVRIRTVVQHFDESATHDAHHRAQLYTSRTTVAPMLEFILVGARMDYHFEHHLYPTIPYYNLRRMHQTLEQSDFFNPLRNGAGVGLSTESYLRTYVELNAEGGGTWRR
jgi:fatty acid desaturase